MVYQFSYLVRDERDFSQTNTIWTFDAQHSRVYRGILWKRGGEEREEEKKEELFKIQRFHSIRKRIHERLCLGVWYGLIRENIREDWLV